MVVKTATNSPDIELVHLPKDESSIAPFLQPYKHFRLESLLIAPSAFASTYSREVEYPDSLWKTRLLSPLANVFIARCATPPSPSVDCENPEQKLLCMLAMLGPLPIAPSILLAATNPWTAIASADQILEDAFRPWHFRFNAIFTMPEARGKGLAKDLITMALSSARDFAQQKRVKEEREGSGFVVSIAVEEDNFAARSLYEKCGFIGIGEEEIEGRTGDGGKRKIMLLEYRENN